MEKNEFRAVIKHLHIKGLTPKEMFRREKMRELVEATGISHSTVISILYEQLGMKKLSAKWVPRLGVTMEHKRNRVTISKQYLKMFQRNPDEFLRRFITVDETWIHYFTPETKEQSKQWTSPALKKAKTVKSAGKMMATVFRYELLPYPAYSPDLAPCDYFLFSNLKKWFRRKRFTTREQLITKIEAYFEELGKSYYSDGLKKLENRWIKCIELKADYVEK
ncbi:SETMR methyltransferase, partial [Pseudoatta argentina]